VVRCCLVCPTLLGRILLALGTALVVTACASVDQPRRSSDSPSLRCMNDPGRGQSLDVTRPIFFLFCAQSP